MGGRIPKFMLERAISQQRWNGLGVIYETIPQNVSLHAQVKDFLSDGKRLLPAIDQLISLSVIGMVELDGMEIYVCGWEPETKEKKLLALLEYILREYSETGLEMPYGNDVVETLLAASRFGTLGKRQRLLSMASTAMRDSRNISLQAEIVHRQSVLLRLRGDICSSKRQIQGILSRSSAEPDLRSHSVLGLLHLSQATNHAYNFEFCQAHNEAQKWKPPANHTQRDMDVVWDQVYVAGRTFKGQGYFNKAKQYFERCLATNELRESKRVLMKANLADLFSELDYLQYKRSNSNNSNACVIKEIPFLDNAEKMIKPEIERLKACGQQTKGFRRLLLALIEIKIKQYRLDIAGILITEILGIYSRLTEPDIVDKLGHIRALIARARISPLSQAEDCWSDALFWNRMYNPREEEVFTCGLVYLFICFIRFQLRNLNGSRAAFDHVMEIINGKMP
ncbi:MAG: hypothetical protein Q9187_005710 [Circinaria calcarea]